MNDDFSSLVPTEYPVRVSLAGPNESPIFVCSDGSHKSQPMAVSLTSQLHCHLATLRKHQVFYLNNMQLSIGVSKNQKLVIERKGNDWIIVPSPYEHHLWHPVTPKFQDTSRGTIPVSFAPKSKTITLDANTENITWGRVAAEKLAMSAKINNFCQ